MPALRELQRVFLSAVLTGETASMAGLVQEDGVPGARRLQIYRNNARENFLATLRATYPVIERLGGSDWFAQVGCRYQARYPSRSGDLQYVGERFAAYLQDEFAGTGYLYFSDMARLEWAYQEVLTAGDAPPFDLSRLAAVAAEDYAQLVFVLHPALRTVASAFPVLAIWRANQPGDPADGEAVDLDSGPGRVLLTRRRDHVELRECSAGLFTLLQALAAGRTLEFAAELATGVEPYFDLAAGLQRLAGRGAFVNFRIGSVTPFILEAS